MSTDDDKAALERAGFEVVGEALLRGDPFGGKPSGRIVVRRRAPPEPESECVRMYAEAIGYPDKISVTMGMVQDMAAFRAALAREEATTSIDSRLRAVEEAVAALSRATEAP